MVSENEGEQTPRQLRRKKPHRALRKTWAMRQALKILYGSSYVENRPSNSSTLVSTANT